MNRPELEDFAKKMEAAMLKNDEDKGESWKTLDLQFLFGKLNEERLEVNTLLFPFTLVYEGMDKDIKNKTAEELVHEAICCMMLAYRLLED